MTSELKRLTAGSSVFDVFHVLERAIPRFNLDVDTMLILFEKFYEGMKNDLLFTAQFKPVEELILLQPAVARKFLDSLLILDKPFIAGYISAIFLGFSKGHERETLEEIDQIKSAGSQHVISGIINVLGNLNYKSEENTNLLSRAYGMFELFEKRNSDDIDAATVHAYGRLLELGDTPINKILHYAKKNRPHIDYSISNMLLVNAEKHSEQKWFEELLLMLTRTAIQHRGTLHNIDQILNILLLKQRWEFVEKFLSHWFQQIKYKSSDDRLEDLFKSTCISLTKNRLYLQKTITRFFNNDSRSVHQGATELISYCNSHGLKNITLDKDELAGLEFRDWIFVAKKIQGYVFNMECLFSLSLSLLEVDPNDRKLQEFIFYLFTDLIAEDYPGSTVEFLKRNLNDRNRTKLELIKNIVEHIEAGFKVRVALPRLKELIAPTVGSHKILVEQSKVMNKSMEKRQERSLTSLFRTIRLKYGNGSFRYSDKGDYTSVSKLSTLSAHVELPNSEIYYPVYAALRRAEFWIAKRQDL